MYGSPVSIDTCTQWSKFQLGSVVSSQWEWTCPSAFNLPIFFQSCLPAYNSISLLAPKYGWAL